MPENNQPTGPDVAEFNLSLETDEAKVAEHVASLVNAVEASRQPSLSPEEMLVVGLQELKKQEAGIHRDIDLPAPTPVSEEVYRSLQAAAVKAAIKTEAQRVGLTDEDLSKHGRALAYLLEAAAEDLERKVAEMAADLARNAVRRLKASLLEQAARG